jgi:ribosomal protein S15P/S13E
MTPSSVPDLRNQLSSNDMFNAFKLQLIKDFEQSNFPSDFVNALEPDYASIHHAITQELQRHEHKTDFHLMNLLYRIDISEAQLKRYLNENKDETYYHVIAELVIKRVLQKVVIKQYYKSNENPPK